MQKKIQRGNYLLTLALCGLVCHAAQAAPMQNDLKTLQNYQSLSSESASDQDIPDMRLNGLRNAAMSLGARGGLAWRSKQINGMLEKHALTLDRIFNFNAMLLEKSILPPVLLEGRQALSMQQAQQKEANPYDVSPLQYTSEDAQTLRIADRAFTILSQARFVTTAPTWRDYLLQHFESPQTPDRSLLPKNAKEAEVWKTYVQQGWQAGIAQSESIYYESLGRLKRDYQGMIRYQILLSQNMVTPPYVDTMELGVTGTEQSMAIGDKILKIKSLPNLRLDPKFWKTDISRAK